jgi:hypothetical protein
LAVNYQQEAFDSIDDSDDSIDDSDDSIDDAGEFLPFLPSIGGAISNAIGGIGRTLLGGGGSQGINLTGVRPNLPSTSGISPLSNLAGMITNAQGKNFQLQLPQNVATKEDIAVLKRGIDAHNVGIKKATDAITKNAQETAKIAGELNRIDAKHTKVSNEQNVVMKRLNKQVHNVGARVNTVGRKVEKIEKDFKDYKGQAQMMSLLPMLMNKQPELESLQLQGDPAKQVVNSKYKDDDNMSMMMMFMMMSGGFGGSGDNNNSMMPLMFLMMK